MKIICLYSIKGGVSKTTTSVNLAYEMASAGKKVLLADLDPQGAASFYLKIEPKKSHSSKALVQKKSELGELIRGSDYKNLDVIPAKLGYRNLDIKLDQMKKSTSVLSKNLKELKDDYDIIFLDSPPNITLLSENIFNAADFLVIPVIPSSLSEMTLLKLLDFFKKKEYSEKKIMAFFSMVQKRRKMHQEIMEELSQKYPFFFKTAIPAAADVEKMGIQRKPVCCFSKRSSGALAYQELAKEMMERLEL